MKTTKRTIKTTPKRLSISAHSSVKESLEYEKDFSKWARDQVKFLKTGKFERLDMDHLIEEIEDLSKREKQRLTSYLEVLLMHMLKVKYQPEMHTRSWDLSIESSSHKVQKTLSENPSLKSNLKDIISDAYLYARIEASKETGMKKDIFPEDCPWDVKEIFPNLKKKYHKSK